jgi:hypothetical protein
VGGGVVVRGHNAYTPATASSTTTTVVTTAARRSVIIALPVIASSRTPRRSGPA